VQRSAEAKSAVMRVWKCGQSRGPQGLRATCRSASISEPGIPAQRSIARDVIERSDSLSEHAAAHRTTYLRCVEASSIAMLLLLHSFLHFPLNKVEHVSRKENKN
jgi:hypothetical protein